jgi:hypothetical protein
MTARAERAARVYCLVVDGQDGRTGKTRRQRWASAPEQRKIWVWAQGIQGGPAPSIRATDNGSVLGRVDQRLESRRERGWKLDRDQVESVDNKGGDTQRT